MTVIDPITTQRCPIWQTPASISSVQNHDQIEVVSPRAGGIYRINRSAEKNMHPDLLFGLNAKLTTWLIEQRLNGISTPLITPDVVESVKHREFLSYSKKLENFFKYIGELDTYVGESIIIRSPAEQISSDKLAAYIEARQGPEIASQQIDEVAKFINVIAQSDYIAVDEFNSKFRIKI